MTENDCKISNPCMGNLKRRSGTKTDLWEGSKLTLKGSGDYFRFPGWILDPGRVFWGFGVKLNALLLFCLKAPNYIFDRLLGD